MSTYIIVAIGQIQRRLVLHVPQHFVGARLTEQVSDGGVLSPHGEVQRGAAVEHGGVHVGSPAQQQLHRQHVMKLHGEMKRGPSAGSLLRQRTEETRVN